MRNHNLVTCVPIFLEPVHCTGACFFGIMLPFFSPLLNIHWACSRFHDTSCQQWFLNNRWCHWHLHHRFGRKQRGICYNSGDCPLTRLGHNRWRCLHLKWSGSGHSVVCSNTLTGTRHLIRQPWSHLSGRDSERPSGSTSSSTRLTSMAQPF